MNFKLLLLSSVLLTFVSCHEKTQVNEPKKVSETQELQSGGTEDSLNALVQGHAQLVDAAKENDYEKIRELLQKGADVNIKDVLGDNALNSAVIEFNTKIVDILFEYGALANEKDSVENTPLMNLIVNNLKSINEYSLEIQNKIIKESKGNIKILIDHGASWDIKNKEGNTAKDLIVSFGLSEKFAKFFSAKEDLTNSKMKIESSKKDLDTLVSGHSVLVDAVKNNNYEKVKKLLLDGADVNIKDGIGDNALNSAVLDSNTKMMTLFKKSIFHNDIFSFKNQKRSIKVGDSPSLS